MELDMARRSQQRPFKSKQIDSTPLMPWVPGNWQRTGVSVRGCAAIADAIAFAIGQPLR
jgi:hypothetical protein